VARTIIASEWGKKAYADGLAAGRTEGRAEGQREYVLRVLELRKLEITDDQCARILACQDLELLSTWYDRAVTAGRSGRHR
jgi:hypothetical protein